MICAHDGHFTQSPSGTRLLSAPPSIGLRTFLNQAIQASIITLLNAELARSEDRASQSTELRGSSVASQRKVRRDTETPPPFSNQQSPLSNFSYFRGT